MRPNKESVLLKTSAATDIQCSGGVISITGLKKVSKSNIFDIKQVKYRAETAQVIRVGTSSYTPTADTVYKVLIGDVNRFQSGWEETLKPYSFRTPVVLTTLGATAALQREAIHLALVAAINADASNKVVAASLLTGTGFSVTDDGSYYPVYSQGMSNVKGVSTVIPVTNTDGSGFAESDYSITTPGVIGVGIGAYLAAQLPVIDFMNGNLVSGVIDTPPLTTAGAAATSGQNYDVFVINSYQTQAAWSVSGQLSLVFRTQEVWVDNGTGSSTSNLAGFKAFERVMLGLIFDLYRNDASAIITMGNVAPVSQGLNTGLPSGVAQAENVVSFGNGHSAHYSPIATSTLVALAATNDGISLILDSTAAEGVELSAPTWANSQKSFVVGKTAFSLYTKITLDDVSGVNPLWVGFRKKAAYGATFTSYSDYAVIGIGASAGQIYTNTELNGAGNTATDTTQTWADATTRVLEVRVDINGVVTFYIDGYAPTVTQALTFDAGDEMIPTVYALQSADIGTPSLLEFAAVATNNWRS